MKASNTPQKQLSMAEIASGALLQARLAIGIKTKEEIAKEQEAGKAKIQEKKAKILQQRQQMINPSEVHFDSFGMVLPRPAMVHVPEPTLARTPSYRKYEAASSASPLSLSLRNSELEGAQSELPALALGTAVTAPTFLANTGAGHSRSAMLTRKGTPAVASASGASPMLAPAASQMNVGGSGTGGPSTNAQRTTSFSLPEIIVPAGPPSRKILKKSRPTPPSNVKSSESTVALLTSTSSSLLAPSFSSGSLVGAAGGAGYQEPEARAQLIQPPRSGTKQLDWEDGDDEPTARPAALQALQQELSSLNRGSLAKSAAPVAPLKTELAPRQPVQPVSPRVVEEHGPTSPKAAKQPEKELARRMAAMKAASKAVSPSNSMQSLKTSASVAADLDAKLIQQQKEMAAALPPKPTPAASIKEKGVRLRTSSGISVPNEKALPSSKAVPAPPMRSPLAQLSSEPDDIILEDISQPTFNIDMDDDDDGTFAKPPTRGKK